MNHAQELFLNTLHENFGPSPRILFLLDKKQFTPVSTPLAQSICFEEKDLRLLHLDKESFQGVWWEKANLRYTLEDTQRILALLFQSLSPKVGSLAVSFEKGSWSATGFESQLKQSGFNLRHHLERENTLLYICSRT